MSIMPRPHRAGALSVDGRRLFVRLSVCLMPALSQEWKGAASLKLARRKPTTQIANDSLYRSTGQTLAGRRKIWRRMGCVFYRDVTLMSNERLVIMTF